MEEMDNQGTSKAGKLLGIYPDGTVQYDHKIGDPSEFPLTEVEIAEVAAALDSMRNTPKPTLTLADFDQALTAHLDSIAKQRRYDNRITCMVRAGFPGPFQAEGIAFAMWCDTCNAAAYTLLANVQAGTTPMPTSINEFISLLPVMVWPT